MQSNQKNSFMMNNQQDSNGLFNNDEQQNLIQSPPSTIGIASGSGAASMLMAANALAKTSAQSVSEALLGQVQIAAAEGQLIHNRRTSLGLAANASSSLSSSTISDIPDHVGIPSSSTGQFINVATPFSVHPASVGIEEEIANSLQTAAKIGFVQSSSSPANGSSFSAVAAAAAATAANSSATNVNYSSDSTDPEKQTIQLNGDSNLIGENQIGKGVSSSSNSNINLSRGYQRENEEESEGVNYQNQCSFNSNDKKYFNPSQITNNPFSQNHHHQLQSSSQPSTYQAMLLAARSNTNFPPPTLSNSGGAAGWYAPLSPRTQAHVQVGNIAANVAVHEYIAQTVANVNVSEISQENKQSYDPSKPFQGVPSTPMMPTPSPAMLPPPDIVMGMRTPFSGFGNKFSTSTSKMTTVSNYPDFIPSYRLAPDEYQILASAAAIATAALTTASTSSSSNLPENGGDTEMRSTKESQSDEGMASSGENPGMTSRALTEGEQEEIAATLRAWAGLEGAVRQEQARQQLERQRNGLLQNLNGNYSSFDQSSSNPNATATTTQFIPPDFARHFQSQLTALAAGYYQKLHADGLAQSHFAPNSNDGMLASQRQQQQASRQVPEGLPNVNLPPSSIPMDTDPMLLVAQASSSSGLSVDSPQVRDQLLQYAHQLYATGGKQVPVTDKQSDKSKQENAQQPQQQMRTELHPMLLPLLHTLHKLHSQHLPTLLLLSCAYYSCGDLAASLWYNKQILLIDSNYVESMSNIGTTLRALGRWHEAESWWWRAVKLRPGYWDAYENLLGVLCSPQQIPPNDQEYAAATRVAEVGQLPLDDEIAIAPTDRKPETGLPRFSEALKLCEFVESNILSKRQQATDEGRLRKIPGGGAIAAFENAPVYMPMHLPVAQCPRLQNLFYAKGNLKYVLPDLGAVPAAREYEKAIEVVLSSSETSVYSVRDLVLSTYVVGVLTLGISLPGAHATHAVADIASAIGLNLHDANQIQQAAAGQYHLLCPRGGVLRLVRRSGDALLRTLLRLGGGSQLPMLMMLPQGAAQLSNFLFAESERNLPALVEACHRAVQSVDTIQSTLQQSQSMTSTVLLTLAKLMQDAITKATFGPHGAITLEGIPPSTSLLLPLYYLSITISPAASTANNLGILLSSIPVNTTVASGTGERQSINGQSLALQYYTYGLQLDPKHPHLYTNFGSLLKDLNHLPEAIQMYEKAIECNPTFDVALANLGNAIKDQGRTQDSVQYYRRAVNVNPNFPEALCGLVNALLAICDWQEVYGENDEGKEGLMARVVELLESQLDEGSLYGVGALCSDRTPEEWVEILSNATGRTQKDQKQAYLDRFQMIAAMGLDGDREKFKINEGSFVIRLVERIMRRLQRKWYVDIYGLVEKSERALPRISTNQADFQKYKRIALPTCLGTPAVPTVLPFHTFTLKIPPRHIRLISHRTALRISQTTMSQLWLPEHVYPPPPPPSKRIKIGYISSDFNNHPLAHLMQSTFGFHDRKKFEVFLYATSASDQSPYRKKIEREAEHFLDVNTWTNQAIISRILQDGIHLLMNLNGYTKGARNEIFAARPCPVQLEFMGFAGGMASSWTDWIVVDPIVCPPEMTSTDIWRSERKGGKSVRQRSLTDFDGDRDPESMDNDWVYTEHFIYLPDSYFVNDHRQGFREPEQRRNEQGEIVKPHQMDDKEAWIEEEKRRWQARKDMWPTLPDDYLIFADFNQLYKLEPTLFKLWLRILQRVPNSILWLLRFPAAGEAHLLRYAQKHFGDAVAARVIFTDVAPKGVHIQRGRIADLFLDTLECGAHTTSADILWSATPVLTWPKHKHKMASRVAASIVAAAGQAEKMIVNSEQAYEDRAVALAKSLTYTYVDKDGKPLKPINPVTGQDVVRADALVINTDSASAAKHNAANNTSIQQSNQIKNEINGNSIVEDPAPANVKKAEDEAKRIEQKVGNQDPLPPRSSIGLIKSGPQAPPKTDSRHSHGELSELRKQLFLTRDKNKLFDTRKWVRHLERGYEEAWKRWVEGIDTEESIEWENLSEDHPAKQSGHIWVKGEEEED